MPNHLAHETSPYLLQHANNPVDWHPWGPDALQLAKKQEKPIFLSIGYSACHWCHVMEHESFEDPKIAAELNKHFICIKVDREERPDLDNIYMTAVQMMTGRGGWPMSVFITPELKPFFGGTYWPPTGRQGMPGFDQVIAAVSDAWNNRRKQAIEQADKLTEHLHEVTQATDGKRPMVDAMQVLTSAATQLERAFDSTHGGFGGAPKFPHSMDMQLLLRMWKRTSKTRLLDMVTKTLDKMSQGGIYDHLAGGFARYSVDSQWLVPHFEKMLYDNSVLAAVCLDTYLATGEERFATTVRETLDYILQDMTDSQGGFYSTEDADSEGEEGKFYVWSVAEVQDVLGQERSDQFCAVYDVTEKGNFEGHNILNLPQSIPQFAAEHRLDAGKLADELAEDRKKLLAKRATRIRPGKDDKVIVSWNGLMIDAMARAGAALNQPRYLEAARNAANFLLRELRRDDGRLLHTWRNGQAKLDAYLDDYACLVNGLVSLYEATFEENRIDEAIALTKIVQEHFADKEGGGFFYTADDHEQLITRQKDMHDGSVPSGNAMMATVLVRLGRLCGREDFITQASETLQAASTIMERSPLAAGQMLIAQDMLHGPMAEIVILSEKSASDHRDLLQVLQSLRSHYLPNKVVACREAIESATHSPYVNPLFVGRHAVGGQLTVYVCQNFVCQAPVVGAEKIQQLWSTLGGSLGRSAGDFHQR